MSIFTRASAAIDRSVLRFMERQMSPRAPRIDPNDARTRLVELAAAYGRGTLGVPSAFFPTPGLPEMKLAPSGDGPLGTQIVDLSYRSDYVPFLPLARELHERIPENHTAHARWWTSGRHRPTIVLLHGWGGGNHWVTARTFVVPYWLRHGYDVAAFVLPFHGVRAPESRHIGPRSGALFPSPNPMRTNEGFGQAIYDLRALSLWLRSRGASAVGAMGMSLGGYTTSLWASIAGPEEVGGIDFAVAMIPAVSMSRLMWRHGETSPVRRRAAKAGITEDLLADAFAVHAPLTRPARLPRERLAVVAGKGDRITPPEQAEALAAHWGVKALWFDGGHLAQVGRGDALREVRRQLGALGLAGREFQKMTRTLADAIAHGPLLLDGAMGSLLYERGVLHTRSYDELVLSQPELIRTVHRDYVHAGAEIIETNTFGANRMALARHGLVEQAAAINRTAVDLARSVTGDRAPNSAGGDRVFVAGAVGPTGVKFGIASASERKLARFALAEQIDTLVLAGVDAIMLETFSSILEMEIAIAVAKERGPRVPVIAMMVFDANAKSDGGLGPAEIADRMVAAGADVVGGNCGIGPAELYQVAVGMVGRGKPVIAQPNAGLPASVEGRTLYVANPEHFGVFARRMLKSGVRMIGGCCGTTPEHTRAMLGAVRMLRGEKLDERMPTGPKSVPIAITSAAAPGKVSLGERSRLGARLTRGEFAVSVELTAPTGSDLSKTKAQVADLLKAGIDIVNIADGPRASARMANIAACARLAAETTVEPILHVCSRDRSFLGLVAHLLGAQALGLRNLVIITGDPPKMGDYPFSTPVYDVDSVGLLRIAAGLNAGFDPAGKPCEPTSFVLATGAEPGAHDRERELRRLEDKKLAGAELVMTQPVYDPRTLERFLDDAAPLGLPVMVGILPLASHRNAEFLHNEVPGMGIPTEYRERMAKVGQGPAARAEGIRIAQEALAAVKHRVQGAYVMPPFNRVDAALAVLEVARDRMVIR